MMTSIESYVRQGRRTVYALLTNEQVRRYGKWALQVLLGFVFSAASLRNQPLPLVLALCCAKAESKAVLSAFGGGIGYLVLWGRAGYQGVAWSALGLALSVTVGKQKQKTTLLLPAAAVLSVAVSGLVWQALLGDTTGLGMYLVRIVLTGGSVWVFRRAKEDTVARWLSTSLGVLALAQLAPLPYLGLGFMAAGMLATHGAFPEAALAGLALDLAGVTPVPMTAVTSVCGLLRLLGQRKLRFLAPGVVYAVVMGLCGVWDIAPLPGLAIGGCLGLLLPQKAAVYRGETGAAQVRLELAAGVFAQTRQLLLEIPPSPIDEEAIAQRAMERACSGCPCRKTCREQSEPLPKGVLQGTLLERPPLPCKKSGRVLTELRRGQEQLRTLQSDRERQREYRTAVAQQYQFAADFMRELSDNLTKEEKRLRYRPEVSVFANRPQEENGDRCSHFAGVQGKYYVLLCDGMGTGMGAVQEGDTASQLLKKLLQAGYPAAYALRSLNSLCALRSRAGAVTVDLAELALDSGKACLYKWGAAPSLLLSAVGIEKIGTAGTPPGLSVTDTEEAVERLSLRRGETLLLLSDGVSGEDAQLSAGDSPGEMAEKLLSGESETGDDATIVTIRLCSASQST